MALGACSKLSKWILLILNTVLLLEGIAMLSLGLWLKFSNSTKDFFEIAMFNTSAFVIGVTVLITLGSVLLGVVAFGTFSAHKENRWGIGLFAALLALLAGSVVVLGGLAYLRRHEVEAQLLEFYSTVYALYLVENDPAIAVTLTLFHSAFHCCGMLGGLFEFNQVKQTCPKPIWEMAPECPAIIGSAIESKALVVMGIFFGTGAVLLAALVCTIMLIRNTKKRPRWHSR